MVHLPLGIKFKGISTSLELHCHHNPQLGKNMTPEEIKRNIQAAMSSFWWCPDSCSVVDREEIGYLVDPTGIFNQVSRIDDQHPALAALIAEFSSVYQDVSSSVITFPEQNPKLFALLKKEGYQATHLHDIRYQLVENHHFRKSSRLKTTIVKNKKELLRLLKTTPKAFGKPYIEEPEENLLHMLREYSAEKPRAIRVIAYEEGQEDDEYALGSGGMSLFEDLGIATFFGGGTIPEARYRGVYSALIDARISYAQKRGIAAVGIYARHGTSAPIVAKQGFLKCGEMQYWERKR